MIININVIIVSFKFHYSSIIVDVILKICIEKLMEFLTHDLK